MKVAVLNTSVPFLRGGAEHLADGLVHELGRRGHSVEHVKIPLRWNAPAAVAESMFAAASLRMAEAERVIALKFPAYLVPHPNKVVWLLHQFRQVYDLWGTPFQDVPSSPDGEALRRAIRSADDLAFTEAKAIYCNSPVTAERLRNFNGFTSEVLLAPMADTTGLTHRSYGSYVLALGRVTAAKRQHLLVEAMAHVKSDARLVVAGKPENDTDYDVLDDLIKANGLESKVELIPRFISESEKEELLADARAVAYLPVDEDSYGYVTAEAMLSAKSVLTTTDAGGILALVKHEETGLVSQPTPHELAKAIDRYFLESSLAATLGARGVNRVNEMGLSWSTTIDRLLS